MKVRQFFTARNICYLAVLLALVVVMQVVGGSVKIGTIEISFVLLPIVLGAMLLGEIGGGILGFTFGLITLIYGITGASVFTNYLWVNTPVMVTVICLVKGTAAGIVPALLYRLLRKKNQVVAVFVASLSAPVANTGLFILGCLIINGTITGWMQYAVSQEWMTSPVSVVYYLVIVCAGVNFLIEFAVNLLLAPALYRVVTVVEKTFNKKLKKRPSQEVKDQATTTASNNNASQASCRAAATESSKSE